MDMKFPGSPREMENAKPMGGIGNGENDGVVEEKVVNGAGEPNGLGENGKGNEENWGAGKEEGEGEGEGEGTGEGEGDSFSRSSMNSVLQSGHDVAEDDSNCRLLHSWHQNTERGESGETATT